MVFQGFGSLGRRRKRAKTTPRRAQDLPTTAQDPPRAPPESQKIEKVRQEHRSERHVQEKEKMRDIRETLSRQAKTSPDTTPDQKPQHKTFKTTGWVAPPLIMYIRG